MLAKFSVRKPLTVLVAVILVIVLGVIAFTRMTPDLLPNIDFPYVIVVTPYAGASPEAVETTVSKPVEQAAATLDGIKSLSSTSSENYSLVILEFSDSVDMDAVCMNLREKLDQLAASWPDEVSTPTMMKINPNMLPVNVSAVAMEGYDTVALSDFVNDTLLPRLEGTEGIASISTSGSITRSVDVVLSEEKLEALNGKIRDAIDEQFVEPAQEIADGYAALEESEAQLADGEAQLADGRAQLEAGRSEAEAQLKAAQAELEAREAETLTQLDTAKQVVSAADSRDALSAAREEAAAQLAAIPAEGRTAEQETAAVGLAAQIGEMDTQLAALNSQLPDEAAIAQLRVLVASEETVKAEIQSAKEILAQKGQEAEKQMAEGEAQLSEAEAQLTEGRNAIAQGESQLDEASEQLESAREDAYEQADVTDIVTMELLSGILQAQDFAMPAGYASQSDTQWLVYVGDSLESAEELEDLMLFDMGMDGMEPVRLGDVADVAVTDNADETYARIDGSEGVLLTFSRQSNYATATASENLEEAFRQLEEEYPGLHFTSLMDQGDYIDLLVDSVLDNLLVGAGLAILILILFLRDLRPTFIVACSIPISVTFAIVLMYFSGVTLNVISMSGLAVAVGMLVDNSIVVIENIFRLRQNGKSKFQAAISGAAQVAGAITASTLTTVCVFAPIVFVTGLTRQLFSDMALTITYSLMASLLVALTLIPAMSSGMMGRVRAQKSEKNRFMAGYARLLDFALGHKAAVLLLSVVLLAASAWLVLRRGFVYMPDMDSTQVSVTISMPEDATLEETAAMGDEISVRVSAIEDVETVGVMQSSGMASVVGLSGGDGSTTELTMYVVLREDKSGTSQQAAEEIESLCADLDCTVSASGSTMDMSALSGSGITVNVYGEDLDTLQSAASLVAETLSGVEGVGEVSDGMEATTPKLTVHVDKDKAMEEGLTTAQVYMQIADVLTTQTSAASVEDTGASVVVVENEAGATLEDVRNMTIPVTDEDGTEREVKLSDIAVFEEGTTLQSITRSEQRRYLAVTATIADGYNVTNVTAAAEKAMADTELPEGIRIEFSGENETIMEAMKDLLLMLLLGIVIVYLIMVAQFQSLLSPFIVMFTIPLAFTGGLIGLYLAGFELSIVSMIGFVILVGIIVNNGIVLIDCMNQLRSEGMELNEAIREASRMRLRPVLMTALTTILALVPMALGIGMGASLVQPVAVVAVGGLVYATFMTLFVVPALYAMWCKKPPRVVTAEDMEITKD